MEVPHELGAGGIVTKRSKTRTRALAPVGPQRVESGGTGILLVDPGMNLLYANDQAIQILNYPAKNRSEKTVRAALRSILPSQGAPPQTSVVTEFISGKRRYYCRALRVSSRSGSSNREDAALLLERAPAASFEIEKVCEKYALTKRERETLTCLVHGLSSREIAARMEISQNTVKAFLRLVMIKMGVSSRSAIMGKLIESGR